MCCNALLLNSFCRQLLSSNESSLLVLGKRVICKSPGQSQKGKKRPAKNIRLIAIPGQHVEERSILGKQKALKYHPGYNVALDPKNRNLYALCAGTVFYSIEKFNANPKSQFVDQFYRQQIGPIYKKYIHVIKDKNPIEFKLIDIV
ncbi:unnamed protein product [Oppiella nova]|uniref:Ribosomal protein L27 n=1 Tax=Oppiella nova TaxID=334625 RepID=A0A7R9QB06_9ACAR|nr:unnamed protein product [Oppiella nova]CAG2160670.1 unnamed protein product [Oppiella nova]